MGRVASMVKIDRHPYSGAFTNQIHCKNDTLNGPVIWADDSITHKLVTRRKTDHADIEVLRSPRANSTP